MRPVIIEEIMEQADDGSDNISNEDWVVLKEYIEKLEQQEVEGANL